VKKLVWKKERQDETQLTTKTQYTTKIGGKTSLEKGKTRMKLSLPPKIGGKTSLDPGPHISFSKIFIPSYIHHLMPKLVVLTP
jgi:hypothetical protein